MRLIDCDEAIINFCFEWDDIPPKREEFIAFLKNQPDAVVRCRDCVYAKSAEINKKGYRNRSCRRKTVVKSNYCPNCGAKMDLIRWRAKAMTERQLKIICYFLWNIYLLFSKGYVTPKFRDMFENAERSAGK